MTSISGWETLTRDPSRRYCTLGSTTSRDAGDAAADEVAAAAAAVAADAADAADAALDDDSSRPAAE